MDGRALVVVVGLDKQPTTDLVGDLRRLGHRPELAAWTDAPLRTPSRPPAATILDFRTLGVDAGRACTAVKRHRVLRRAPSIAVVPELEAARLDLSLAFDDVILAPYRITDLAVRLRLIRRRAQSAAAAELIRLGNLTVNEATYEVAVGGAPIELTLKEYQLLRFLVRNPGRVFTRAQLLDHVWGADYLGGTRTVDVHIRRIRAKTEMAGDILETVRGVGYRLAPPPEPAETGE